MIYRKKWFSKQTVGEIFKTPKYVYYGTFLFGFIPLYIERVTNG